MEDKKKLQIKAIMEKAKREGKDIDWVTIILC